MNRMKMITIIEFKLFLRNFYSVFFAFVFPVMMLLLFGSIYGNEPVKEFGNKGTIDVSVPAYTCMVIGVTGLMSLPLTITLYRERKVLKRFMASPINPFNILASQIIINFVMTLLGMIVLILVGKIIFDLKFFGNIFVFIIAFIIVTMCIFSIGIIIAGISKNTKASNAIAYIIYFPMLFLSGATIPIEFFPKKVLLVSKALPLTYGVSLLKGIWLGERILDYTLDIVVLLTITFICTILAIKFFRWE